MTTREILIHARARIEDERNWCQGNFLTPDGRECALGALNSAAGCFHEEAWECLKKATGTTWGPMIYNDAHTHAEVLAMFDRAIDACVKPVVDRELVMA